MCCYHNVQHCLVAAFFGRKQVAARHCDSERYLWRRQGQVKLVYFILLTLLLWFLYNITICCEKKWHYAMRAHQIETEKHRIQCCNRFSFVFFTVSTADCDKRQRAPTKRPNPRRRKKSARQMSQAKARAKSKTTLAYSPQDAVFFYVFCCFIVQRRIFASSQAKMSKSMN